jgi:hypothetical protein
MYAFDAASLAAQKRARQNAPNPLINPLITVWLLFESCRAHP